MDTDEKRAQMKVGSGALQRLRYRTDELEVTWRRLVLAALTMCVVLASWPAHASKPNIIVILADDLGVGDLSFNGSVIRTPNIDALARDGAVLTSFYASANVCSPSRAGLLTGRYPIRAGLAHGVVEKDSDHGLRPTDTTIAEFLKDNGYRTAIVGKWHLGHKEGLLPTRHGFEYFYGLPYSNDMRPLPLYRDEQVISEQVDQSLLTQDYTREAIGFIEDNKDRPFFLYLSHTFPHIPLYASEDFKGKSAAGIYGDTVEELDWSVGRVMAALREHDLAENTLVIFTSDNGAWFEGSNGRLRDMKGLTWDGGYRVPLIASWAGRIPAGARSAAMAMNIDIFPTVHALVSAEDDAETAFDGRNILPLLKGEPHSPHDVLYFFNDEDVTAVRTRKWKYVSRVFYKNRYIDFDGVPEAMGFEYHLLFDMSRDDPERYSLASNNPEVVEEMRGLLSEGRRAFEPLRTRPEAKVFP